MRNFREPLTLDFLELGLSLEEVGEPKLRRGCTGYEALLLIEKKFMLPGSWLYAEVNNEVIPITIAEEAAYAASVVQYKRLTADFDKRGKGEDFKHGIFKDKKKERRKRYEEAKASRTPKQQALIEAYNRGENPFASIKYTTEAPKTLKGGK